MQILTSVEARRGCGYRRAGPGGFGLYLMGAFGGQPCERLPYPVVRCPTCGHGIKHSRSWTWVDPREFFQGPPLCHATGDIHDHGRCPLCSPEVVFRPDDADAEKPTAEPAGLGLIWIGEKHYPTWTDFAVEAARMGVSRRLPAVPKGFVPGTTWVALVHPKGRMTAPARNGNAAEYEPAICHVFRPHGFDLVVETDDPEKLPATVVRVAERLQKVGGEAAARIVRVIPEAALGETAELFEPAAT